MRSGRLLAEIVCVAAMLWAPWWNPSSALTEDQPLDLFVWSVGLRHGRLFRTVKHRFLCSEETMRLSSILLIPPGALWTAGADGGAPGGIRC